VRLLPLIDDTPKPYDHPKQLWRYRVVHTGRRDDEIVWARSSGAARYAVAKRHHPLNAIYYAGGYRARREP